MVRQASAELSWPGPESKFGNLFGPVFVWGTSVLVGLKARGRGSTKRKHQEETSHFRRSHKKRTKPVALYLAMADTRAKTKRKGPWESTSPELLKVPSSAWESARRRLKQPVAKGRDRMTFGFPSQVPFLKKLFGLGGFP